MKLQITKKIWVVGVLAIVWYLVLGAWNFAAAATNISAAALERWAWNDVIAWIDFNVTNNVLVTNTKIEGYASSAAIGSLALDCATSPNGDICATSNFQVANTTGGQLAGWAWNDNIGWVSFCGNASGGSTWNGSKWVCPAAPTYQVTINTATGDFSGWAWNDVVGWISFNCANTGTCGTSNYKVKTTWSPVQSSGELISSIFDTEVLGGSAINTIMWQGTQPAGTKVKFQIASSNSSTGPWSFIGPDGSGASFYEPAGPNVQAQIKLAQHNNKRYVRYKAVLEANAGLTSSSKVEDIIINFSP